MSLPSLPFLLLHALNDELQFARLVLRSVSATAGKIFLTIIDAMLNRLHAMNEHLTTTVSRLGARQCNLKPRVAGC